MYIEELKGGEKLGSREEEKLYDAEVVGGSIVVADVKRVLVGAGARALLYLTLLYNVVRNKIQAEFRWWDWVDEVQFCLHGLAFSFCIVFYVSTSRCLHGLPFN
ncbi:hypothetical protein CsSME_00050093 [Camellia sinensis var. sinensis]